MVGDAPRTVIVARTKLAAEEAAVRLGFSEPWAHPVTLEVAQRAHWLPKRRSQHRHQFTHKASRGLRI
jgi:hypothetical protein